MSASPPWFDLVIATAPPLAFLVHLLASEVSFSRRRIALSGAPPIDRRQFFACKYLAIGAWFAVVLQALGIGWRPIPGFRTPPALSWSLWVSGFGLLFLGRIALSTQFRLGLPNEATRFRNDGVFRFTRNPMYAGIDVTVIAAVLLTGNPALLAAGVFVVAVQHRIILAEESWLLATFADDYVRYRDRVGRYVTLPLAVRGRARALGTLLEMGHCAPTFMRSILRACGRRRADWLVRLASAMPGGIGNTGCECGGITSPLMLLGLLHGLRGAEGGLPTVFDRARHHIEVFRRRRCTVLCREIRGAPNRILPCIGAVAHTGGICAETICGEAHPPIPAGPREAYRRLYAAFDHRGFHCARTVLRRFDGLVSAEPGLLDAASAFVGGTSFEGLTCSALTAGVMALGLGIGQIESNRWHVLRMVVLILTGGDAFHERVNRFNGSMNRGGDLAAWFTKEFGSTRCRDLTRADFASPADVESYLQGGGISRCQSIARGVADRVESMLGCRPGARRAGAAARSLSIGADCSARPAAAAACCGRR